MTQRQEIRAALKALYTPMLETPLPSGKTVTAIHDTLTLDIAKKSPVIVIASNGSDRSGRSVPEGMLGYGTSDPVHNLRILIFVMLANVKSGIAYSSADAEAALEEIEAQIYSYNASAVRNDPHWRNLSYSRESRVSTVSMEDGTVYLREEIPIAIYP